MKIKQKTQDTIKPKAQLLADNKGKFKKKEAVAANGKDKKLAKLAAGLVKGDSLKDQVNVVKTKPVKNGKLNPAQVGMLVDDLLSKKGKKKGKASENAQFDLSDSGSLKGNKKNNKKQDIPAEKGNKFPDKSDTSDSASSPGDNKKGKKPNSKLQNNPQNDLSTSDSGTMSKNQKKKMNKNQKQQEINIMKKSDSPSSPANKKKGNKQKNQASIVEQLDGKKANKRKATEIEDVGGKKPVEKRKYNPDDFKLVPKDVLNTVNAALNLHKKHLESSKKLLDSDPKPILVKFTFYHSHPAKKIMRFNLEHSTMTDSADVCLIVADLKKKNNEETVAHWKDQLKKSGLKISEVLPLASLRKDYTQFVDKRKLSDRFDNFLIQSNIYSRAFGLLGSTYFHEKRKTPVPVKLDARFKHNIELGLKKVSAMYNAASRVFSIQVGHTEMKNKEIQENVLKIWEDYPTHFGVLWDNVQTASLIIPELPDLPFFCSLYAPLNGPTVHDKLIWAKSNVNPVIGEHPTKVDQKVLVYPSGKVVVKAPPQKELTEEELEAKRAAKRQKRKERKLKKKNKSEDDELDSDDSIGGRADMLASESESDEEQSDEEETPQVKGKKKQNVQEKKGKKIKKEESEEESESDVERVEEEYLKELAAQKKSSKGKEKAKESKKGAVKKESSDEDSDDDDDDDLDMDSDDFESDDGDAESDEVMDESNFGNDSSSEDDDAKPSANGKGAKLKPFQKTKPQGGLKNKSNQNPKQKSQNKPGAQKVPSSPPNKKPNKKNAQQTQNDKKKPADKNSFQGVKADLGKKKKNKSQVKNKAIAKKLK